MYIWNVTLYEPSPVNGDGVRPMRSGMLSRALCDAGHEVELWMPGFEHVHHQHYRKESCFEQVTDGYWIQYIKGCGYKKDVSLKRYFHNKQIAKEFLRLARIRSDLPDLLFTQVPSLELAEVVVNFAQEKKIPVVVDVRDPWPDIYRRLFPNWCNFLFTILFFSERCRAQRIFQKANAITAVSKSYLNWAQSYGRRKVVTADKVFNIGYSVLNNKLNNIESADHKNVVTKMKEGILNIFFAGTFGHNVDLHTIIEAAEIIFSKEVLDIHFVIAGKGEGETMLKKKAKELKNFSYVGWLDSVSMNSFLESASIGLAPFPFDALNSLPNKPFEYMAASLPIITSLDGELRQLIEEKKIGMYYSAGNAKELVDCLLFFRDNPEIIQDMGKRAREVFDSEFRSDLIYPKFVKHLEKIVSQYGVKNA